MGQKGNIKNLYKEWRLFLKQKKKQKEEKELEKKKYKKPSKIKVFFVMAGTILLSPFFFSQNKETKKEIKDIKKEIDNLKEKLETTIVPEEIQKIKTELIVYQQNLKEAIKKQPIIEKKKEIKIIQLEIQQSKLAIEKKLTEVLPKSEKKDELTVLQRKTEKQGSFIVQKQAISITPINSQSVEQNADTIVIPTIIQNKIAGINQDPNVLLFLTTTNLEIEDIKKKLKDATTKSQIVELEKRIYKLNTKRLNFMSKHNIYSIYELYLEKDKFRLLQCNDTIELLFKECEEKKKNLISTKQKTEKKKETKIEEEKPTIDLNELNQLKDSLQKDLIDTQKQVKNIKKSIINLEPKLKKITLLGHVRSTAIKAFKICFGFLPVLILKNKWLGGLLSAFMVNNSLRSMRNTVNEQEIAYLEFETTINKIQTEVDCIKNTRYVYEDAIIQVRFLKRELLNKYELYEVEDILLKIGNMEEEMQNKNRQLMDMEDELSIEHMKAKQKTKKHAA